MTMLSTDLRRDIEKRAIEISTYIEEQSGKRYAEILPGVTALWHVVNVAPNQENRAVEFLAERGFGVFLPRFIEGSVLEVPEYKDGSIHPHKITKVDLGEKLIFPGRLFLFVWDVLAHWRRINVCPFVQRIMVDGGERPVIVADKDIDRIQALQFTMVPQEKAKRKRRKASVEEFGAMLSISTKSVPFHPEGASRTSFLDNALVAA
jgi:transcription antitermination factor NusG